MMKKWLLSSLASVAAITGVSAVATSLNTTANAEDAYTLTFEMPSVREDWAESSKIGTGYLLPSVQTIEYQTEEVYAGSEALKITETAGTTSGFGILNTHEKTPTTTWDANKAYTVSFRIKGAPIHLLFDHGSGGKMLDDWVRPEGSDWTYYEYTFTPSEIVESPVRYNFCFKVAENNGVTYIDDFFVEEYQAPTTSAVTTGNAIGTLPTLEAGKVWAIDGEVITSETVWNYTENKTATIIDAYTLTFKASEREDWAESSKMGDGYLDDNVQTIAYQNAEVYSGNDALVITETAGTTSGFGIFNTHTRGPIAEWDANKAYTVSFRMKGSPIHLLFDHGSGGKMLDEWVRPEGSDWTYYEYTFTPSEIVASPVRYNFCFKVAENNGVTYIDDFFVEEYKATTVAEGNAIGTLPTLEAGKAWAIDGEMITSETVWNYTENKTATIIDVYTLTFEVPSAQEDYAESSKIGESYLQNVTQTIAYQTEEVYAGNDALVITETAGTTSGQAIFNTHAIGPIKEWDANKTYTVSFMAKGSPFHFYFDHAKGTDVLLDDWIRPIEGEWTYYELTFTPSEVEGAIPERYSFMFKVAENYGVTYIDNFFIEECSDANVITMVEGGVIGELPVIPEKEGYTNGKWMIGDDEITADTVWTYTEDQVAEIVYTAIEYTVTFKADGEVVATETYTVENTEITAPAVPEKAGYTGAWETYTLDIGDKTVNAQYTVIEYTVTFKADGEVVATETYTVENTEITVPAVPEKAGYTGVWETYTLENGDVVVNAVYTKVETEPDSSTTEPGDSTSTPDSSTSEPDNSTAEPDSSTTVDSNSASSSASGGCGGTLGLSGAVAAIGFAVAALRKKKED